LSDFRIAFTWPPVFGTDVSLSGPQLVDELERLIRRAKYTLDLYFYNINTNQNFILAQELRSALTRGVKIRAFCDSRSDGKRLMDTFRTGEETIDVWFWQDPGHSMSKFHIKAIVTDNRNVYLGSANMSQTAMQHSAECGLFGTNPAIAKQLDLYVQQLITCGNLEVIT
jgi:phosphatidylserine/phosphatidylglycerophosphate/cardiolipin synthase-like enzyme